MRLVAALLALVACGDNRHAPDAPLADARADASDATDGPDALAFVAGPTLSFPSTNAPLSGRLELTTNRPTRLSVRVTHVDRSFTIEPPALATTHALPVLELRAETLHQIVVTATDEDGATIVADPLDVMTSGVPGFAAAFTATQLVPGQIEPGLTIGAMNTFVFAVDLDGRYVWFVNLDRRALDVTLRPDGTFLVLFDDRITGATIDPYGTILESWQATSRTAAAPGVTPVAVDTFHHELAYLPSGDLVTLSTERRELVGYPTSETDPAPRAQPVGVVGDVVAVFGTDGTVRATHSLLDAIDPYRVAYGSFGAFWSMFYAPPPGSLDWSHGNAVIHDPSDGGFITSLRHQDALVKLDANGDLVWILGTHDNWAPAFTPYLLTPVGAPFAWPFHQHAPKLLPNGNLLVFDNGNFRVSPPTPPPSPTTSYSRAVEYAIDPVAKEVRQVWEYAPAPAIFAPATGDVDVGATTGNVIVTFGTAAEIVEVTHTTPPIAVFRIETDFTFYRTERVRSLYP